MKQQTPWGEAEHKKVIADGITRYDTAGHGGYHVSEARLAEMPDAIRRIKTWAGPGWYEEDCDWVFVVLAFPQHFDGFACWQAIRMARTSDYVAKRIADVDAYINNTVQGAQAQQAAEAWFAGNKDKYEQGGFLSSAEATVIEGRHMTSGERIRVAFPPRSSSWARLPTLFTRADAVALGATVA